MPKNSKQGIIDDEKEVLCHLRKNATLSALSLGKKLGATRQKIWRIRKDLEENNKIWGYTTIVDYKKLNVKEFVILIKRSNKIIDEKTIETIFLNDLNGLCFDEEIEIETFMCIYGKYDWMIHIIAKDVISAKSFISKLRLQSGDLFEDIILLETMDVLKKNWITKPNIMSNKNVICKIL